MLPVEEETEEVDDLLEILLIAVPCELLNIFLASEKYSESTLFNPSYKYYGPPAVQLALTADRKNDAEGVSSFAFACLLAGAHPTNLANYPGFGTPCGAACWRCRVFPTYFFHFITQQAQVLAYKLPRRKISM